MNQAPHTLWSLIERTFRRYPDQCAWICRRTRGPSLRISYAELERSALAQAADLRARGVTGGDVVAVMAPNGPQWSVAALAGWKLGAIVAPIHVGNSEHDIEQQIRALRPKCILAHDVKRPPAGADAVRMDGDAAAIERERELSVTAEPDHEAVRLYTSGSTGVPKMVRLSHRNIASNVKAASTLAPIDSSDRFLSLLPFSHAMGLTGVLLLPMYCGSTMIVPKVLAASEILAAMSEERITIIVAVPRLFRNLMQGLVKRFAEGGVGMRAYRKFLKAMPLRLRCVFNAPIRRHFGGKVKCWISGGSRLDPEITRFFHDIGLPLRQGYGLTETSPVVSVQEQFDPVLDSVGKPLDQVQVKVHEPDASGGGELWIRGPNVMLGYVDEGQTREVMHGAWFNTGDIGHIDSRGNVVLTGRSKRLIITEAGKNVYPEELETLLERDATVKEAAVIEQDMRPVAIIAMQVDDADAQVRRVLKEFNHVVSQHNRISRFALVDELPRTPLGKIALHELPAMFARDEVG